MKIADLPQRDIREYARFVGDKEIERLLELAEGLKGLKVTHVNSTAIGGGVSEILRSLTPLMRSVGLDAEWEVMEGPQQFFEVTKAMFNALQGARIDIGDDMWKLYLDVNRENAEKILELRGEVIVVHDHQPLAIREFVEDGRLWLWRCHSDLTSPYEPVWKRVAKLLERYAASIFHLSEYVKRDVPTRRVYVVPPSIDPLSPKNIELSESEVLKILNRFGIDPEKPILLQVARFDPWKDPFAAVDVYRKVREKFPGTQLLLVTAIPVDDPECVLYMEKVARYVGMDKNVHILTNLHGVGHIEVNAFQRAATVALQMSKREGFGLAVTEALWKCTPVIARPSGGIKLQVIDGVTGYLVNTVDEAAEKAMLLIKNRELREKLGKAGREHVRKNFLVTRHLRDYLRIIRENLNTTS